ncbi:hypothetical protein [Variovorax rhizosphaerae]|uniref:Uncharacterized protein n=1 Tax=Variovorax rhizosphaerae TaxID=1836200 RepID=A0ABU8WE29_9BURK
MKWCRYYTELLGAMGLYAVVLTTSLLALKRVPVEDTGVRIALSLSPTSAFRA